MGFVRAAIAALALLSIQPFAQAETEATKDTSSCRALVERFGSKNAWWWSSMAWPELESRPAPRELAWQAPLGGPLEANGFSFNLVAHPRTGRCYMAVCGGFANACRLFEPPGIDGNAE